VVYGTTRRITIREDNLPGSWRASDALTSRIFRSSPGALIDEPVPTPLGFYVVQVEQASSRHTASLAEASAAIRDRLRSEIRETMSICCVMLVYNLALSISPPIQFRQG